MPDITYYIALPDGSERQANAAGITEEIKNGTITVDTPLWREGWSEWRKCGTLPEFHHLFKTAAVPPPSPYKATRRTKRLRKHAVFGTTIVVFIASVIVCFLYCSNDTEGRENGEQSVQSGGKRKQGNDLVNVKEGERLTALKEAIIKKDLLRVKALLKKGADANAVMKNNDGDEVPMLAFALDVGDAPIVQALLDAGADANAMAKLDGEEMPMLFFPIAEKNEKIIKALLDAGANANSSIKEDGENIPLLYMVIGAKESSSLKRLLAAGADANQRSGNKARTPLMYACHMGSDACVKVLLQAGANIFAKDNDGVTALMIAEERGEEPCAKLIREAACRQR